MQQGNANVARDRRFLLGWTALSTVGLVVGLPLGLLASGPLERVVAMMLVTPLMFLITGATLGSAQWLALRRRTGVGRRWVIASAVGLAIGLTGGTVAVEFVGELLTDRPLRLRSATPWQILVTMVVIGGAGGGAMGLGQWWSVRGGSSALSGRWILSATAALAAGFLAGYLAAELLVGGVGSGAGAVVFLATASVVAGLITGRAVLRCQELAMLDRARSNESS